MISKYQPLDSVQARLMGFAMAIKDLHEAGHDIAHDRLVASLIQYVTEYEMTKAMINEHAN